MMKFRRFLCLSAQIRAIRGDKSSELVPHAQIDNSLDAETRLKAAESMIRAGLQSEGGQLECGEYSVMVKGSRLDKKIVIDVFSVFSTMFDIQAHGKPRVKGQMRTVKVGKPQRGHYQEMMLLILPRRILWYFKILKIAFLFIIIITSGKA